MSDYIRKKDGYSGPVSTTDHQTVENPTAILKGGQTSSRQRIGIGLIQCKLTMPGELVIPITAKKIEHEYIRKKLES